MIYALLILSSIGLILMLSIVIRGKNIIEEIINDYNLLREYVRKYNKSNKNRCRHINEIKEYIKEDIYINRYSISNDGQWLIVKNLSKKILNLLVKEINTETKIEGSNLFICFFNLNKSTIAPKAIITMKPSDKLNTTTKIEWGCKDSITEGNVIKNVEWKGKKNRYSKKGEYKVELRVQDKNDNWSEWTEKVFNIVEIEGIEQITCGGKNLFVIFKNGNVEGFGQNKYGQLGTGFNEDLYNKQELIRLENVKQIASGEDHTIILQNDRLVKAIGRNNYGQLGNGDVINSTECVEVWGMENIIKVDAGKDFSAALSSSGEVMMWGNNEFNQLGEYDVIYRPIPKKVSGIGKVKQIALGHTHTVALLYDGTVVTWGSNLNGECGTGFIGRKQEPSVIEISNVKYIAAGRNYSLAVLENGRVYGWGKNNEGQLGIEETQDMLTPREISGIENVEKITCKDSFTVALTDTGRVFTWGKYRENDESYYKTPTQLIGIKYVKDIANCYSNGYLLTDKDRIMTWSGDIEKITYIDEENLEIA